MTFIKKNDSFSAYICIVEPLFVPDNNVGLFVARKMAQNLIVNVLFQFIRGDEEILMDY